MESPQALVSSGQLPKPIFAFYLGRLLDIRDLYNNAPSCTFKVITQNASLYSKMMALKAIIFLFGGPGSLLWHSECVERVKWRKVPLTSLDNFAAVFVPEATGWNILREPATR